MTFEICGQTVLRLCNLRNSNFYELWRSSRFPLDWMFGPRPGITAAARPDLGTSPGATYPPPHPWIPAPYRGAGHAFDRRKDERKGRWPLCGRRWWHRD